MTKGIKLSNQEKSECSEKRNFTNTLEYWRRTPNVEMKEKLKKRIPKENEKNYIAETLLKG